MEVELKDLDRFPHPHLAVDVALLTLHEGALHALLLPRPSTPYAGAYALPGGFVRIDESVEQATERVLERKCGLRGVFVEQLYTFGAVRRDPRARVVSVAHYALVPSARLSPALEEPGAVLARLEALGDDAEVRGIEAFAQNKSLKLAFDHAEILGLAVQRLRGKIDYAPVGFELLPASFTLLDLLAVHQAVLGRELNKDSFRRRMLASGRIAPTGTSRTGEAYRPAALYRFKRSRSSSRS